MKIYAIRHGQTDWNLEKRIQGSVAHPPLNETGIEQARQTAIKIKDFPIKHIYSSDSVRAKQTAEILGAGRGPEIHIDPRLRERGWGDYEGRLRSEISNIDELYDNPHKCNAESFGDVFARIKSFFDEIRAQGIDDVLVVTHGGTLSVINYCASNNTWDDTKFVRNYYDNASINVFEF